jgi:hypothetical protein
VHRDAAQVLSLRPHDKLLVGVEAVDAVVVVQAMLLNMRPEARRGPGRQTDRQTGSASHTSATVPCEAKGGSAPLCLAAAIQKAPMKVQPADRPDGTQGRVHEK